MLYYRFTDKSLCLYYLYKYKGVTIGSNCSFIGFDISFGSEPYLVKLGNDVRVSFDVSFVTHDGGTFVLRKKNPCISKYGEIVVGNNVFIGAKSLILPNVRIGDNVIIGAGSIVTKDVPCNSVYAGIPAKLICTIEEYEKKNANSFVNILNLDNAEKEKFLIKKFSDNKWGLDYL